MRTKITIIFYISYASCIRGFASVRLLTRNAASALLPQLSKGSRVQLQETVQEQNWEEKQTNEPFCDGESSPINDEYIMWVGAVEKAINGLTKKKKSLHSEKEKAAKVEQTVMRAQLITSSIYLFAKGERSATVQNWETGESVTLTLDPAYDSPSEEANALFERARKLKRGSKVINELLDKTELALEQLQELQEDLGAVKTDSEVSESIFRLVQEKLRRSSRSTGFSEPSPERRLQPPNSRETKKPSIGTPASNLRKLVSPAGCTIVVGRNRRGNEYLTFNMARGDDVWMHARGCPGAHVLLQQRRGSPKMTENCLQLAADLAAFYSDARSERRADIMAASPKHLLKPRGGPLGAVKVREEWKVFTGFPDNVPDDFKLAREESGQSEEYRAADKAKHRRRNREAQQAKNRAR